MPEEPKKECDYFFEMDAAEYFLYQYYVNKKDDIQAKRALHRWCEKRKAETDPEKRVGYGIALNLYAKHCMDMYQNAKKKDSELLRVGINAAKLAEEILEAKDPRNYLACRYNELRMLMELKEYNEALALSEDMLQKNPGLFQVVILQQECCMELRKAQEVINLYNRGLQLVKNHGVPEEIREEYAKLFENAAEVFQIFNQFEDSAKILEEAREQKCESDRLILLQLLLYQKVASVKGSQEEQLQALQKVTEGISELKKRGAKPELLGKAYFSKAVLERNLMPEENLAEKSVQMVIKYAGTDGGLVFSCGRLLMSKRNYEEAKRCFLRLTGVDGYSAEVFSNLIECNLRLKRIEEAFSMCEVLREKEKNLEPYYDLLADVAYSNLKLTEKKEDADRLLEYSLAEIKLLEEKKEDAERFYVYCVEAYLVRQQYEDAMKFADAGLKTTSQKPYLLMQKAKACLGLEKWTDAFCYAREAYEAAPEHQKEAYLNFVCQCSLHLKNNNHIFSWYGLYFSQAKEKAQAYGNLLRYLKNMDEADAAIKYIIEREADGCCEKDRTEFAMLRVELMKARKNPLKKHMLSERLARLLQQKPQPYLFWEAAKDYLFYFNQTQKAIECLNEFLVIKENKMYAMLPEETAVLLQIYRDMGDYKSAAEVSRMFFALLMERTKTENEADAVSVYMEKGLYAEHGRKRNSRVCMALIYAALGNAGRARELEQAAGKYGICNNCIFNRCLDMEYLQGCILEAEGNYEEAKKCYRKILQEAPGFLLAAWRLKCIKKK